MGTTSLAPFFVESEISDSGRGENAAADLDLDGDLDLILEDEFRWLEFVPGDPPTFIEHNLAGGTFSANGVVALDLNGDGRPDIAATLGLNNSKVTWHENIPGDPPTFHERPVYIESGYSPWEVEGGDLDGDGDQDLISWNTRKGDTLRSRLMWYENDGTGLSFTPEVIYEAPDNSAAGAGFIVQDLDGDGDLDIFITVNNVGLRLFKNDGAPNPSWLEIPVDEGFAPAGVAAADFDRDGDIDLLGGHDKTFLTGAFDEARLYENLDGELGQIEVHSLGLFEWGFVPVVIDLNNDGWMDLFLASNSSPPDGLRWLENQGSLNFTLHHVDYVDEWVPKLAALALDIAGDGNPDLVGPQITLLGSTVRIEATRAIGAWSTSLIPDRVRCRNLSTGQTVSSSNLPGPAFNCEELGLSVSPGDRVQVSMRGVAQ